MIAMTIQDAVRMLRPYKAKWEFRDFDCIVTAPNVRRGFHMYYLDNIGSLVDAKSVRGIADHFHNRQQD